MAFSEAVELGQACEQMHGGYHASSTTLRDMSPFEYAEVGGKATFNLIFETFYSKLFAEPEMAELFNESPEQRPAKEHGELLASFLLERFYKESDEVYRELIFEGKGHGLGRAHSRAKTCPRRSEEHRGRGFRKSQGYAWIGFLSAACDEVLAAKPSLVDTRNPVMKNKLLNSVVPLVFRFYGPWIES
jgi:truncated hemoglobin YjbI